MLVLQMKENMYEVCEREVLEASNASDQSLMAEASHYVKYASYVYVKLPNCVMTEFTNEEEECTGFKREEQDLFHDSFKLTSIGMDYAKLFYSNFINGIVSTPYSILVDDEKETIVIVVRGTRSLEDLVVDLQVSTLCVIGPVDT